MLHLVLFLSLSSALPVFAQTPFRDYECAAALRVAQERAKDPNFQAEILSSKELWNTDEISVEAKGFLTLTYTSTPDAPGVLRFEGPGLNAFLGDWSVTIPSFWVAITRADQETARVLGDARSLFRRAGLSTLVTVGGTGAAVYFASVAGTVWPADTARAAVYSSLSMVAVSASYSLWLTRRAIRLIKNGVDLSQRSLRPEVLEAMAERFRLDTVVEQIQEDLRANPGPFEKLIYANTKDSLMPFIATVVYGRDSQGEAFLYLGVRPFRR